MQHKLHSFYKLLPKIHTWLIFTYQFIQNSLWYFPTSGSSLFISNFRYCSSHYSPSQSVGHGFFCQHTYSDGDNSLSFFWRVVRYFPSHLHWLKGPRSQKGCQFSSWRRRSPSDLDGAGAGVWGVIRSVNGLSAEFPDLVTVYRLAGLKSSFPVLPFTDSF